MIDIAPYQPLAPDPIRWQDVYPKGFDPEAAAARKGYELLREFRYPAYTESWLSDDGEIILGFAEGPRLIVRKRRMNKFLLTEIRRADVRDGDLYRSPFGHEFLPWPPCAAVNEWCRVYRVTELPE